MYQSTLLRAIGSVKDQTRIGLAKVGPVKDKIKKIDGT
jgi:hypothetical protein